MNINAVCAFQQNARLV